MFDEFNHCFLIETLNLFSRRFNSSIHRSIDQRHAKRKNKKEKIKKRRQNEMPKMKTNETLATNSFNRKTLKKKS